MTDFWLCAMHHGTKVTFFAVPMSSMSPAHGSLGFNEECDRPADCSPMRVHGIIERMPELPMGIPLIYGYTESSRVVLEWLDVGRRVLAEKGDQRLAELFGPAPSSAPVAVPVDDYMARKAALEAGGAVYWLQPIGDDGKPSHDPQSEARSAPDSLYTVTPEVLNTMQPNVGLWRCLTKPERTEPVLLARWSRSDGDWEQP